MVHTLHFTTGIQMIMKVEIVTLLLFVVIFLTDAVEATDEDINSPLVSYLLAKLQRLEAKMMVRPNIRNTRQTTDKPAKAPIVADNKQCKCPPSVVTYIRWGNSTCPYGADVIYSGVVAGSWWDHTGAAVDPLCLPLDPQYLQHQSGYQGHARLYGAEYEIYSPNPLDHSHQRNVPYTHTYRHSRTEVILRNQVCAWFKNY